MRSSPAPNPSSFRHFSAATWVTVLGLSATFAMSFFDSHNAMTALRSLFICAVLAVLEISLSFDNAVVNASILSRMSEAWQRRFITWGLVIAVFGMRLLFPLLVVATIARISPWAAFELALHDPHRYSTTMQNSRLLLAAFGGAFLSMVALHFFFDERKDIHWIEAIELRLSRLGRRKYLPLTIAAASAFTLGELLPASQGRSFFNAASAGLLLFLIIHILNTSLARRSDSFETNGNPKLTRYAGLSLFIYLEALDASFSFDGVVGAFAITHRLLIITIGLTIGAMYVRSLTLLLVERRTLNDYRFLEHGAFYAIGALAITMFASAFIEIPEFITGGAGAVILALSYLSSRRALRTHPKAPKSTSP